MSTLSSINAQLQALYDDALAVTRDFNATTLTKQVNLLIDGYNPSGSSNDPDVPTTTDETTKFYIYISDISAPEAYLNFTATVDGGTTIDWGDDSDVTISSGTDNAQYSHTYSAIGSYTITLTISDGTITLGNGDTGDTDSKVPAFGSGTSETDLTEKQKLKAVKIGENVAAIGARGFKNCTNLKTVLISSTLITELRLGTFATCSGLSSITLPDTLTTIGGYVFQNTYKLKEITIPSSVTSVGAGCFDHCGRMEYYYFLSTTPPTLGDTQVFNGILGDCIIYVPSGTLSTYQTKWSKYKSYLQEQEEEIASYDLDDLF